MNCLFSVMKGLKIICGRLKKVIGINFFTENIGS